MESRVRSLEDGINDLKTDIRLMTQTLNSIDKTLAELKSVNEKLVAMKIAQNNQGKDIEALQSKANILFKKIDIHDSRLERLDKSDTEQGIKMGGAEKFVWVVVTAFVGIAVGFWQGGK